MTKSNPVKYLVCKKQKGEGCDYTIGCGMRFDFIEAASIEAAIERVVFPDGRVERSALEGEGALETIFIIPAECVTVVDVAAIASAIKETREREAAELQGAKELAEFNRLKAKYGD